jgi:hypothetical protein
MSLWEGSKSPRGTERNLFSTDSIHLPEQCHDERLLASSSGAIKQKMWTIPLCNLQNKCCFTLVVLPSLPLFFPLYFQNKNPGIWSPKLRLGNRISTNLFTDYYDIMSKFHTTSSTACVYILPNSLGVALPQYGPWPCPRSVADTCRPITSSPPQNARARTHTHTHTHNSLPLSLWAWPNVRNWSKCML